jgi:hypothetical protein
MQEDEQNEEPIERVDEEMPAVSIGVGLGAGVIGGWGSLFVDFVLGRCSDIGRRSRGSGRRRRRRVIGVRLCGQPGDCGCEEAEQNEELELFHWGLFRRGLTVSIGIAEPVLGFIALNERRAVPL